MNRTKKGRLSSIKRCKYRRACNLNKSVVATAGYHRIIALINKGIKINE